MPDGRVTEVEEEIKSKETVFLGGESVEIAALFKTGNPCQTRLNPRPKKKKRPSSICKNPSSLQCTR